VDLFGSEAVILTLVIGLSFIINSEIFRAGLLNVLENKYYKEEN
jgi:hypothetical protein